MILAKQSDPGLGLVPAWQFAQTNPPNIKINPHVTYPEGWNQSTIQPVGAFYASPEPQGSLNGLGRTIRDGNCCWWCACSSNPCCDGATIQGRAHARRMYIQAARQASTVAQGLRGPFDAFESPFFAQRKWLVFGGVALLGLAILGGATALLR